MPAKYTGRTIDQERHVASTVATLRLERGWSYQQLADRMKAVGCTVHPSGIQKMEKGNRRVTVDELTGYARALEVRTEVLLGEEAPADVVSVWATLAGAERLARARQALDAEYAAAVADVRAVVGDDPELRERVVFHREKAWRLALEECRRRAAREDVDVSTPEAMRGQLERWGLLEAPALRVGTDVLGDGGPALEDADVDGSRGPLLDLGGVMAGDDADGGE